MAKKKSNKPQIKIKYMKKDGSAFNGSISTTQADIQGLKNLLHGDAHTGKAISEFDIVFSGSTTPLVGSDPIDSEAQYEVISSEKKPKVQVRVKIKYTKKDGSLFNGSVSTAAHNIQGLKNLLHGDAHTGKAISEFDIVFSGSTTPLVGSDPIDSEAQYEVIDLLDSDSSFSDAEDLKIVAKKKDDIVKDLIKNYTPVKYYKPRGQATSYIIVNWWPKKITKRKKKRGFRREPIPPTAVLYVGCVQGKRRKFIKRLLKHFSKTKRPGSSHAKRGFNSTDHRVLIVRHFESKEDFPPGCELLTAEEVGQVFEYVITGLLNGTKNSSFGSSLSSSNMKIAEQYGNKPEIIKFVACCLVGALKHGEIFNISSK